MESTEHLISQVILDDFDYWNFLQQSIGATNPQKPWYAKHPPANGYLDQFENQLDYLIRLYEDEQRRKGIGWQQPMTFSN